MITHTVSAVATTTAMSATAGAQRRPDSHSVASMMAPQINITIVMEVKKRVAAVTGSTKMS